MGRILYKKRIFRNEVIERFEEDDGGIYIIQKNHEIVFIGSSGLLRKDILECLSFMKDHRVKLSFYSCSGPDFNPTAKAEELLQKHKESCGTMPAFNECQKILASNLVN
jgi:hypothetical protein